MRIAIVSMDTRGGIQPYVALGRGLRDAGHDVRMVAPSDFAPMMAEARLPLAPLSGNVEEAVRLASGVAERGTVASMRLARREMATRIEGWTRETLEACQDVDVVSGGVGGMVLGLSVADRLGKLFIPTHLQPVAAPTGAYPGVLLAGAPRLGGFGWRVSHHLSDMGMRLPFRDGVASARKVLGLRGRSTAADGRPVLYGFSRHVVPVPVDADHRRHVTGYWYMPPSEPWRPPAALEAFLAAGGPVVSIGFGSMSSGDPEAMTTLVLGALRSAGVRAVLLAGWGGLGSLPVADDVFVADALPHDWLFPRVAAVVHHGGAGTTGAALRAGVPAIVVPFAVDQPFWGSRVAALGVGPSPIPRKRLTQERLADALRRTVADEAMHARAGNLGGLIQAEDGVAVAVEHFGRVASTLDGDVTLAG